MSGEWRGGQVGAALLSKQGVAITALARELLSVAEGGRAPRIQDIAARHELGAGTVQGALGYLEELGATALEPRGRLGTFARRLDYGALWELGLRRAIVGALPLPYSLRFEGLATGIRQQFARSGAGLDLRFTRGSAARLEMLAARACDFALTSRFAAESAASHGFDVEPVLSLGPGTYMAGHTLVARAGGPDDPLAPGARIGIDAQSTDHTILVRALVRHRAVELTLIEYSQGLRLLRAGAIDATVWSAEDLPDDRAGLRVFPLDETHSPDLARLGEAAIVVARGDRPATNLLAQTLDAARLLDTQRAVVAHERMPSY